MADDNQTVIDGVLYAGAQWYPRRVKATNVVHWFYGPRLRPGVDNGKMWCLSRVENHHYGFILNSGLSENLAAGIACTECGQLHPLPAGPLPVGPPR